MGKDSLQEWDLWFPQAAASGLSFARSRIDPAKVVLVHAAPPTLTVWVRDSQGRVLASGNDLLETADTPITRLTRTGDQIKREDIWPSESDLGTVILLPGGEAGILKSWWNASDHSEWRWQMELYNHR